MRIRHSTLGIFFVLTTTLSATAGSSKLQKLDSKPRISAPTEAPGLPFETDLTKVKVGEIGIGHRLLLRFHMSIPDTQKLNRGAPSNVSIFEKQTNSNQWVETKRFNLNGVGALLSDYAFNEAVELNFADSEVAIHTTIYHCGRIETKIPCFIQGFQGFAKRNAKTKNENVNFDVKGFTY